MSLRACVIRGAGDFRVEDRTTREVASGEVAVDIAMGGICGSDLHYYHHGAVGDFTVREPLVLGHEVVGHVAALGRGVKGPELGAPVAIHPATPCAECAECKDGHRNVCRNGSFLGSASRMPHVQGGFIERLLVPAQQVRVLSPDISLRRAVLAEPLAVAVHAVHRAGDIAGKRVLVVGAGPIGCLVVAVLRHEGAGAIVACDMLDTPLEIARRVGATATVRADPSDAPNWPEEIDVAIEASGTQGGLRTCVERVRRSGIVVMLGLLPPGEVAVLGNAVVTRELSLVGAFRFDREFDEAIALLEGDLDVDPIVTHTFSVGDASIAFDLAGNRAEASKVLLDFTSRSEGTADCGSPRDRHDQRLAVDLVECDGSASRDRKDAK